MDIIQVKDGKNRVTISVAEKGATGPQGPQGVSANLIPATNATLGAIIVGDNLSITGNGVLSAQPGGVTAFNNRTGNVSLTSNDVTTALAYTPLTSSTPYSNGPKRWRQIGKQDSRVVRRVENMISARPLGLAQGRVAGLFLALAHVQPCQAKGT